MKKQQTVLLARYLAVLRGHLERREPNGRKRALRLGQTAMMKGLTTFDLTAIHQQAVDTLVASQDFGNARYDVARRAALFHRDALRPLETAVQAARKKNKHLAQHNEVLRSHAAVLDRTNRRLAREVVRRKAGEVKLAEAMERYRGLFVGSQLMQGKLRQLTRQILVAQEEERKKISRELHDEVVQTLVGINVALSALSRTGGGPKALKERIARTQRLVEKSVNAVHRFARDLRPAVLDDLGLIPALQAFSGSLAARTGIRIRITAARNIERLSVERRAVLFRVAQEALNNVARHAEATQVTVGLREWDGAVEMDVNDNGKSFEVGKTLCAKSNKRLGLIGMKERIEMVGGRLTIESAPGTGTTVRTAIPFSP